MSPLTTAKEVDWSRRKAWGTVPTSGDPQIVSTSASRVTYPNMLEWFEGLGVEMEISDMSFSVSTRLGTSGSRCEWGSRNGISGLLAQKSNAVSPSFWRMIREILKFKNDALK